MQTSNPPRPDALLAAALLLLCLAGPAAAPPPPAAGAAEDPEERWYVMELSGEIAGWAALRWWSEDGRRVTEAETSLRLSRGAAALEVALAGRFVETAAGEPLTLWVRRALGSAPVETTYRFLSDRVEAETVQAGRERRESLPLPQGEWLTPAAARAAVRRHHEAGDRSYRLRALDPLEGIEPVTITRTRLGEPAAPGAAGRWHEELSSTPGVASTVELDAEGELVWSTTEVLGLAATLRRADRAAALAAAGGGPGPELLLSTLVRPDRPIPHPERAVRGVYELSLAGEGILPDLPDAGGQRTERRGDRTRVTVTVPGGLPGEEAAGDGAAGPRGEPSGPERDRLLAASAYLDHEDPAVRRLLERGLAATGPPDADPASAAARARALTELVRDHVEVKDLDTGFATASEVARSGSGDCTEHSVLLAALLRGAGIPSRVVTGVAYLDEFAGAEGVFGYHMWVQALIDGRWLDLDATLPGGFGAAHIALGTSELAGPDGGRELDGLLALVGRLEIRVIEVETSTPAP